MIQKVAKLWNSFENEEKMTAAEVMGFIFAAGIIVGLIVY